MATKLTKTRRELLADIAGPEWLAYQGSLGGYYKTNAQGFVCRVNKTTLRTLLAAGLIEIAPVPLGPWSKVYYRATPAGLSALKEQETGE